jgi:hypothetical protein
VKMYKIFPVKDTNVVYREYEEYSSVIIDGVYITDEFTKRLKDVTQKGAEEFYNKCVAKLGEV